MKRLSGEIRSGIESDLVAGLSTRQIATKWSVSHTSVMNVRKDRGIPCVSRSNGRPRSITPREEARIVRSICSGKAKTATDAHRMLVADSQRVVTPQTVRNMLRRRGLIAVTRKRKPLLKASHRRQRLAFAHKYGDWTVEDWKRVIWSDETKINRLGSDGRLWRWKKRGSGLCENEVAPTVKFGGGSIMIWGCMTYQGVGFMSKIDSTMDSKLYVEILN